MFERIVVVTRNTNLEDLLVRHHSLSHVEFFLTQRGESIDEYKAANKAVCDARAQVMRSLPDGMPIAKIDRSQLSNFLFRERDLVIAIGPDGLFANLAKYTKDIPILTVNPDPSRIDGVLMFHSAKGIAKKILALVEGEFDCEEVTLAVARSNDGQELYAANDFLVGRRDQVSAYYRIKYLDYEERQSSSGVLISTGMGSSGWMKSVFAGAQGVVRGAPREDVPFDRGERYLMFAVREPFPSSRTGTEVCFGIIEEGDELIVSSEMPEGGVIFSDGVADDAIEFNSGSTATISVARRVAKLIVGG